MWGFTKTKCKIYVCKGSVFTSKGEKTMQKIYILRASLLRRLFMTQYCQKQVFLIGFTACQQVLDYLSCKTQPFFPFYVFFTSNYMVLSY